MKTYVCDWCESIIKDPFEVKLKEFSYSWDGAIRPAFLKKPYKLHMCDYCYKEFRDMIIKKSKEKRECNKT